MEFSTLMINSLLGMKMDHWPLSKLFAEVKTQKIVVFIEKIYCSVIRKFLFFHVLLFILIMFSLYYLTLFSIVYKCSQMSWFTGCLYSVLTSIIVNIGTALGLSIVRFVAIAYQSKYLYNLELYISKMHRFNYVKLYKYYWLEQLY